MEFDKKPEISEVKKPVAENYKDIKPEGQSLFSEAKGFLNSLFEKTEVFIPGKQSEGNSSYKESGENHLREVSDNCIENKVDGLRREKETEEELNKKYPEKDGYTVLSEQYLRNENGEIVKDSETGSARRIDFVVVKDGKVVDSVEVTSLTADKNDQTAKEERIRDAGGNYIKMEDGALADIPDNLHTRIDRRE